MFRTGAIAMLALFGLPMSAQSEALMMKTLVQSGYEAKFNAQDATYPEFMVEVMRALSRDSPDIRIVGVDTYASLPRIETALKSGRVDVFLAWPERTTVIGI